MFNLFLYEKRSLEDGLRNSFELQREQRLQSQKCK